MADVFVSIGSNLARERSVRHAVTALRARHGPLRLSPVYECAAVGFEGAAFYNLVAGFDTDVQLEPLVDQLHRIEADAGRDRGGKRLADRTLDLDVLLYGDLVRHDGDYDVPRSEILHYAFVLGPLADIAPDHVHPELGVSFRTLWDGFDRAGQRLEVVDLEL